MECPNCKSSDIIYGDISKTNEKEVLSIRFFCRDCQCLWDSYIKILEKRIIKKDK